MRLTTPIAIVSGGCNAESEADVRRFEGLLGEAFDGFAGTILSGGTEAGISGLIGRLAIPGRRLSHAPRGLAGESFWMTPPYTLHWVEADGFSPRLPLHDWLEILANGFRPATVRLLGVNGGALSSFEFRLAAALGAQVGVLAGSGRSAADFAHDAFWSTRAGVVALPSDAATIRRFLQPGELSRRAFC